MRNISWQIRQGEGHLIRWIDGPGGQDHRVLLQAGAVECLPVAKVDRMENIQNTELAFL